MSKSIPHMSKQVCNNCTSIIKKCVFCLRCRYVSLLAFQNIFRTEAFVKVAYVITFMMFFFLILV